MCLLTILVKCKTVIQIVAIIILLSHPADWSLWWVKIGVVLMYVAAFLTLWSMISYLNAAKGALTES